MISLLVSVLPAPDSPVTWRVTGVSGGAAGWRGEAGGLAHHSERRRWHNPARPAAPQSAAAGLTPNAPSPRDECPPSRRATHQQRLALALAPHAPVRARRNRKHVRRQPAAGAVAVGALRAVGLHGRGIIEVGHRLEGVDGDDD
jgi:hypothetical protein